MQKYQKKRIYKKMNEKKLIFLFMIKKNFLFLQAEKNHNNN